MNLVAPKASRGVLARPVGTGLGFALQYANGLTPDGVGPAAATLAMRARVLGASRERAAQLAESLCAICELVEIEPLVVAARLDAVDLKSLSYQATSGATLLLVDTAQPAQDMARFARRVLAAHKHLLLTFVSPCKDAEGVDAILRAGARGVIPRDYRDDAFACALRFVMAGHRFRPFLRSARTREPAPTGKTGPTAQAFNKQAEKPLSPAELDVCRLVAQHLSDREIAEIRGAGRGTVRTQVTSLMRKLGCKRRDEAGEIYRRLYEVDEHAVQRALAGETVNLDWLLEFMDIEKAKKGQVLFRRGQSARKLYYLETGEVRLSEIGTVMKHGALFGEIGLFKPDHMRTHTAECLTDVELRTMDAARVWRYYQLKPQFAVQVVCLVTRRLLADIERLRG